MLRETRAFGFLGDFEPQEAQKGPKMGFERLYCQGVTPQDFKWWLACLNNALFGILSCKNAQLLVKIRQFSTSLASSTQRILQNINFPLHLMLPLNWKHNVKNRAILLNSMR